MKVKLGAALAAAGCALALSVGAAKPDTITTFDVSASMSPVLAASCSPACTLSGTVTIDVTLGHLMSVNITMAGESPSAGGPFTTIVSPFAPGDGSLSVPIFDPAANEAILNIVNGANLIGYTGGPLGPFPSSLVLSATASEWGVTSGSLTPETAVVPAPVVGAGLPGLVSVLMGGGLFAWWRRRRRIA